MFLTNEQRPVFLNILNKCLMFHFFLLGILEQYYMSS